MQLVRRVEWRSKPLFQRQLVNLKCSVKVRVWLARTPWRTDYRPERPVRGPVKPLAIRAPCGRAIVVPVRRERSRGAAFDVIKHNARELIFGISGESEPATVGRPAYAKLRARAVEIRYRNALLGLR